MRRDRGPGYWDTPILHVRARGLALFHQDSGKCSNLNSTLPFPVVFSLMAPGGKFAESTRNMPWEMFVSESGGRSQNVRTGKRIPS